MATKSIDPIPQIATRAYELYQERGGGDGHADQDWLEAERETKKDDPPK